MNKNSFLLNVISGVLALMVLSACSAFSSILQRTPIVEATAAVPTPVLVPTLLGNQAQAADLACLVAELSAIQTNKVQGDLIAWSPVKNELAVVQPVNKNSGWYIGDVLLFDAQQAAEVFTSKDEVVFGDLTWAPDGSALAYVLLDQENGIYTIKTVNPDDGSDFDIFGDAEIARTDEFASQKGILNWQTFSNLIVTSACGTDCVQLYQYNPVSQSLLAEKEIRENDSTSLVLENDFDSPDGAWRVTVDEKDNVWLSSTFENRVSLLLAAKTISEIKWSADSSFMAIRLAEKVIVYQVGCSPVE